MGSLICEIKLSKEEGVLLTVIGDGGKITQTVHLDGTAITTQVKGSQETSTITQTQDEIHIKCKSWVLEAESITCTSTGATKHSSKDTFEASSTGNMNLKSQQNLEAKATSNVNIEGMKVATKSTTDTTIEANTSVAIDGKTEVKVKGLTVTVEGQAQAELKAAMVTVKAQGVLNAEASGVANLKGSVTNIGGSLVKVG